MTPKRKAKPKAPKAEETHWQVFERNGSIGAFLMFHRTKAMAQASCASPRKSPPR